MNGSAWRKKLWLTWLAASLGLFSWLAYSMLSGHTDQSVFMPGPLSPGHHQLQQACAACHADPLGGGEVLQQACVDCHGDERRKPFDSHPLAKFQDPRNADRLEHIDALHCVTCHSEHRPEITLKNGLTQPADLCFHCHSDIAKDRPSHEDMAFTSCAEGGCHNFHDNRALYTKFLIKHLDEPDTLEQPLLPAREFAGVLDQLADYPLDRYPVQALERADADAPAGIRIFAGTDPHADWAASAHARSGVNCSACHEAAPDEQGVAHWVNWPETDVCTGCHGLEAARFRQGRHGMRLAAGLPPLQVADSLLPMKEDAAHKTLTCNSCHGAHDYDVQQAAVEACMDCHDDGHSLAYEDSPHYELWQQESSGALPPGSGVSCATCHMPRVEMDVNDWMSRITVDHNQSASLAPNSKMIRTTCLQCHGLAFSLDALADQQLIDNNFKGRPSVHVETMELAAAEKERRDSRADEDDDTSMFGF